MLVEVTAEDIEYARKLLSKGNDRGLCCPVSLALERVVGEEVYVEGDVWWLDEDELIPFSRTVQRWINRFDTEDAVQPFTFRTRKPKAGSY